MVRRNGGFIGTDGLDAPDPPTGVTGTGGNTQVSVAFTAPTDAGTSSITGFVAQVSTDGTDYSAGSNTGTSSPIVVTGLTNGTAATAKVWAINSYGTSSPSDASSSFTPKLQRALFAGGNTGSVINVIQYIEIPTTGNTTDFGDLEATYQGMSPMGSSTTRGVWSGGNTGAGVVDSIRYVTIATTGNTTDFGDLTLGGWNLAGLSNSTRGLTIGGASVDGRTLTIDYITIASTGDATDFGDTSDHSEEAAGLSSSTRGVYSNIGSSNTNSGNVIEYVTIGSVGNATDFGDLSVGRGNLMGAMSNGTRGVFAGGNTGSVSNVMDYITIASTGNATDFGDLTVARNDTTGTGSSTRGVVMGGNTGSVSNVIDYITIASTGDATDFGNLASATEKGAAISSDHGGLQ
tara:strand:- start:2640 stop:3851 length:1212 start_codon:yes stop_codon:yes gene_type:complete